MCVCEREGWVVLELGFELVPSSSEVAALRRKLSELGLVCSSLELFFVHTVNWNNEMLHKQLQISEHISHGPVLETCTTPGCFFALSEYG